MASRVAQPNLPNLITPLLAERATSFTQKHNMMTDTKYLLTYSYHVPNHGSRLTGFDAKHAAEKYDGFKPNPEQLQVSGLEAVHESIGDQLRDSVHTCGHEYHVGDYAKQFLVQPLVAPHAIKHMIDPPPTGIDNIEMNEKRGEIATILQAFADALPKNSMDIRWILGTRYEIRVEAAQVRKALAHAKFLNSLRS